MTTDSWLQKRPLGKTGLEVTPICFGATALGNMPATYGYSVGLDQALDVIRAIFTGIGPVNFLDTAAEYGNGESERRIGLVIRELGGLPPGFVLSTKADRDSETQDFSAAQMRRSVESSLEKLGLEQIQLLYLHDPEYGNLDEIMGKGGAVEELLRCKEEGLIAHLGIAGGPIDVMTRFVEMGVFEAAISHNRYTLLNTEADPFWDTCAKYGVACVNAAPYGSGILVKGPSNSPLYRYQPAPPELLKRAFQVEEVCKKYGVTMAAAALQFSLRDPRLTATIVGVAEKDHLEETLKLAQEQIPPELWQELGVETR